MCAPRVLYLIWAKAGHSAKSTTETKVETTARARTAQGRMQTSALTGDCTGTRALHWHTRTALAHAHCTGTRTLHRHIGLFSRNRILHVRTRRDKMRDAISCEKIYLMGKQFFHVSSRISSRISSCISHLVSKILFRVNPTYTRLKVQKQIYFNLKALLVQAQGKCQLLFMKKLPPYALAGFDITTHRSRLLGVRQRQYH
jgi:hypothetical protein